MKVKFYLTIVLVFLILVFVSSFVSALTGSIGNARMVLKAEVGDTIEKYVLVKNVNDESVNISLSVSGNLTKETSLEEKGFILQPGEDKKAYFTIKPKKPGTYETRINVQFASLEDVNGTGGSGVGLSSAIILIVYGRGELPEDKAEDVGGEELTEEDVGITGSVVGEKRINPILIILPISTLILLGLLLFVLIKARKKKIKVEKKLNKRADRSS